MCQPLDFANSCHSLVKSEGVCLVLRTYGTLYSGTNESEQSCALIIMMSSTTNNTALGRPPGSPRSQPSGRLTTLPSSPSATLSVIAAAADVDRSPNPNSKKKRKKQKPQSGASAPVKSAPRSRNIIYYKPSLRGVLGWAREDEYSQGEIPSAEEMELFDGKFTTEANQGFTNPQLSKKAKEDRRKFL